KSRAAANGAADQCASPSAKNRISALVNGETSSPFSSTITARGSLRATLPLASACASRGDVAARGANAGSSSNSSLSSSAAGSRATRGASDSARGTSVAGIASTITHAADTAADPAASAMIVSRGTGANTYVPAVPRTTANALQPANSG